MATIVVTVLPVAQGSMNLIEERNDLGQLTKLILIDCGGIPNSTNMVGKYISNKAIDMSINYTLNKMNERAQLPGSSTKLDYLLITHRDEDHYNLIEKLFNKNYSSFVDGNRVFCMAGYDEYFDQYMANMDAQMVSALRKTYIVDGKSFVLSYNDFDNRMDLKYSYENGTDKLIINSQYLFNGILEVSISGNEGDNNITSCLINKDLVLINDKQIYLDSSCETLYEQFADWTAHIIDICTEYENKNYLTSKIRTISKGFHKTVYEVEDLAKNVPTDLYKPIDKCFIGGETNKQEDKMDIIRRLSKKVVADWNSAENICVFDKNSIKFEIVRYYSEKTLKELFETDSVIYSQSNATSAIGMLSDTNDTNFKFVFPGDATCHTFYAMLCDESFDLLQGASWTAPHHGSIITLESNEPDIVDKLLKKADIRRMVVSAGYNNPHGLPNRTFILKFEEMLNQKEAVDKHELCFNNVDGNQRIWKHKSTTAPLFTTLVCNSYGIGYVFYSFLYNIAKHQVTSHIMEDLYVEDILYTSCTAPFEPEEATLSRSQFIKRR